MYRFVICFTWIFSSVSAIPTLRSSTKCSVEQCSDYSLSNCSSNEVGCFHFQTTNGTNICAPTSSCESLDPCTHDGLCVSNRAVCILNSCCAQPVCLPLVLVDLCSPKNVFGEKMNVYTTTTTAMSLTNEFEIVDPVETTMTSTKGYQHRLIKSNSSIESIPSSPIFHPRICPNASWNSTGIVIASFPDLTPDDFFLNQYDEIYLPDRTNRGIRKYIPGNDSSWISVFTSEYLNNPTAIFVDFDQNIYIWDSEKSRVYFWSFMKKNIQILLSFDGCNQSADSNEICFGKSLFVDSNSSIYISESSKKYPHTNRVMKFQVNSTLGRVVAGLSTSGSGSKQLHSPGTILVDSQGILYVADLGNSRIQAFQPDDRNGQTKMSMKGLSDFLMDEDGRFYVAIESENVIKRMNGETIIQFVNQPRRIRFALDGSIYVLNHGNNTIQKFQIINNSC